MEYGKEDMENRRRKKEKRKIKLRNKKEKIIWKME